MLTSAPPPRPIKPPGIVTAAPAPAAAADRGALVSSSVNTLERGAVISTGAPLRPANVIARDDTNDLALLSSTLTSVSVPSLRPVVRTGESIAVYGFPLAGLLPSTGNFTVGNITAVAGLLDDTSMLQISAPVQLGNSGGPVLDQWGNVVGVGPGRKVHRVSTVTRIGFVKKVYCSSNCMHAHYLCGADAERAAANTCGVKGDCH